MKRSVVVVSVLLVACGSKAPNPWAVKKWDAASLAAWADACAETTGTKTEEGGGWLSAISAATNDRRQNMSACSIAFDQRRGRLEALSASVLNGLAEYDPKTYRLEYQKQLAVVLELAPANVRATVRSVASGPHRAVVEHPFYISGGFISPSSWHLDISLVKGY